jgi:uncharacterized protein YndB with AHSA1/START domain
VGEVTKEIWIDAPPEQVYPNIVEPQPARKWYRSLTDIA